MHYCQCHKTRPKAHLSTETTVSWSKGHLSDTNTPLYKDHLSTETTVILYLDVRSLFTNRLGYVLYPAGRVVAVTSSSEHMLCDIRTH